MLKSFFKEYGDCLRLRKGNYMKVLEIPSGKKFPFIAFCNLRFSFTLSLTFWLFGRDILKAAEHSCLHALARARADSRFHVVPAANCRQGRLPYSLLVLLG